MTTKSLGIPTIVSMNPIGGRNRYVRRMPGYCGDEVKFACVDTRNLTATGLILTRQFKGTDVQGLPKEEPF